jgi:hypothetical protein
MAQPLDSKAITESERASSGKSRSRFIRWFFIVGACAPIAWVALSYATRSDWPWMRVNDAVAAIIWYVECATFPTEIAFLDVGDPGTMIGVLLFVIPINGAYFAVVGLVIWYVREGVRRLWKHW